MPVLFLQDDPKRRRRFTPQPGIAKRILELGLGFCLALAGCSQAPQFRLNTDGRDPKSIQTVQAEAILGTLQRLFGTPEKATAPDGADLDPALLEMAAGPASSDEQGNPKGLYRQHCVVCHGVGGDGAGPTAAVLEPYPRDFRLGVFKYTSTAGGAKPVPADLERTLRRGIPGTAMPSFNRLADREVGALVEYVRYLSLRGQTELYLLALVVDEDELLPLQLPQVVKDGLVPVAESWAAARQQVVAPPPEPPGDLSASIEAGRQWFASPQARCVECHGPEGRGDGPLAADLYDDWNKGKKGVTGQQSEDLARWYRLPLQRLRPRDLTEGVFRGGNRPQDLYWRVHIGIKGTPMPGAGPGPGSPGTLTAEQIWHVARYVRWLGRCP